MGFYQTEPTPNSRNRGLWRWAGVVVLSALVGSGATLALAPMVPGLLPSQASPTSATPTTGSGATGTPVASNVNVSVNSSVTQVVKAVEPDVVAVVNYTTTSNFYNQQAQTQASDIGSGVFFYRDANYAYIVTNNHVVEGGTKVEIVLQSGKHVQAQVVGTDAYTDLGVLKVPVANFGSVQPVQFANSDNTQVGEPTIAIGTPMGLDFADTVTSGIVSGKQRMMPVQLPTSQQTLDYQAVIQTDAAINPGNSGGPLLNVQGQMIGINSSKIAAQGFEGMGFAIPSNEVRTITTELMQTGHAVHPSLGISGYDLSGVPQSFLPNVPVNDGVLVQSITSADAKAAGLKRGDVITDVNGQTIQSVADLRTALFQTKPGQMVTIGLYRGSKKMSIKVKVGEASPVNAGSGASGNDGSGGGSSDPFSGGNPFGW